MRLYLFKLIVLRLVAQPYSGGQSVNVKLNTWMKLRQYVQISQTTYLPGNVWTPLNVQRKCSGNNNETESISKLCFYWKSVTGFGEPGTGVASLLLNKTTATAQARFTTIYPRESSLQNGSGLILMLSWNITIEETHGDHWSNKRLFVT